MLDRDPTLLINILAPETRTMKTISTPADTRPAWLTQLQAWKDSGTLDRIGLCVDSREVVKIKRSSGAIQDARVAGMGHAGRGVVLRFETGSGEREKYVMTESFLEINPGLDLTVARGAGES